MVVKNDLLRTSTGLFPNGSIVEYNLVPNDPTSIVIKGMVIGTYWNSKESLFYVEIIATAYKREESWYSYKTVENVIRRERDCRRILFPVV